MFYAKKNDFDIKDSWAVNNKKRPPSGAKQQDQVARLQNAGQNAVNTPNLNLDKKTADFILKDLPVPVYQPQNTPIEQLLNQHKIREQSPQAQMRKQENDSLSKQIPTKNEDLLISLTQRLQKVEKLCHSYKLELKEKTDQVISLEEELAKFKKYNNSNQDDRIREIEEIKKINKDQQQEISEMKEFLLKYGMKWVGSKPEGDDQKLKQMVKQMGSQPLYNYHLPKEISIDQIIRRVDELNYIMEKEGATEVVKDLNGMHKIKRMDPFPIGFYANGIAMKGFKFYPYTSNDAHLILADVLDGYFPYQLKKQYPNGTLLKVVDKTEEMFDGEKLLQQNQMDIHQLDERQFKPQTKDEFLAKLPKHVIKNGKIIPIRSEIEKNFKGSDLRRDNEGNVIIETKIQKQLDEGQMFDENEVCTLKFRTESGQTSLIAVMLGRETISEMYSIVKGFRENKEKAVQIFQNYPRVEFLENDQQTLEEAGLLPNAQLFFK